MKTIRTRVTSTLFPVLVTCFPCVPVAQSESVGADAVSDAFRSRLEADYDGARRILDAELEKHPQNARARFELARLECYLDVGGRNMVTLKR